MWFSIKNVLILGCILCCPMLLAGQWAKVNTANGSMTEACQDGHELYVAGDAISKSASYGLAWEKLLVLHNELMTDVSAVGDTILASSNERLFISYDDGQNWDTLSLPNQWPPTPCCIVDVLFFNNRLYLTNGQSIYNRAVTDPIWQEWTTQNWVTNFKSANGKVWVRSQYDGILKTSDNGNTWNVVFPNFNEYYTVSGDTLIVGSNDSLFVSLDEGNSWDTISFQFNINSPTDISLVQGRLFAIRQDWIYVSDNLGASWSLFYEENTYNSLLSVYRVGGIYVLSSNRGAFRSFDDGVSWYYSNGGLGRSIYTRLVGFENYVAANQDNGGVSFTKTEGKLWSSAFNFTQVKANSVIRVGSDLYGLFEGVGLRKATNGDERFWQYVNADFFLTYGDQLLSVDGDMLVLFDGFIKRSADNGLTWTHPGELPWDGFYAATFHNYIYTYDNISGVNRSNDWGVTWENFISSLTLPPTKKYVMQQHGDYLYILDHDNGLFTVDTLDNVSQIAQNLELIAGFSWVDVDNMVIADAGILIEADNKLYYSPDFGMTWGSFMEGLDSALLIISTTANNEGFYLSDFKGNLYRRSFSTASLFFGSGKVNEDININGTSDAGESGLPGFILHTTQSDTYTTSGIDGNYYLFVENVPDTIALISNYPWMDFQPSSHIFDNSKDSLDFQVNYAPNIHDTQVSLTSLAPFRPGFESCLVLTYLNYGTEIENGSVHLHINTPFDSIQFYPPPLSFIGDTATWSFDSLARFESRNINICLGLPASVPIGDSIYFYGEIRPLLNDLDTINNAYLLIEEVVGSFDPNDKQVTPSVFTTQNVANQMPLTYTIRFQNTGNFPASFITVTDTLSQNLDPATFRVLASSHPMTWTMEGAGVVSFRFDNINLPDSTSNEPASHGFVKYSIQAKPELVLNDVIENTAYIYFDFNAPEVTNTVMTVVENALTYKTVIKPGELKIAPNPTTGIIGLQLPPDFSGSGTIWLHTALGQTALQKETNGNAEWLDISALPKGIYCLRWEVNGRIFTGKVVLQ